MSPTMTTSPNAMNTVFGTIDQTGLATLDKIAAGTGTQTDVATIQRLAHAMQKASLCGLGQGAPNPIFSTLRYFRDEYMAHIEERRCPAGVCEFDAVEVSA